MLKVKYDLNMVRGVSSMQMYIFLLVSTTMFKHSSTSCDIIDDNVLIEETYLDENCRDDRLRYRGYLPEGDCLIETDYLVTKFRCTNTSIQEIFISNLEEDNKHYFYVSESSLISLIPDARTWSGLKQLTLENTNISKIVPGFFSGLTELTLLSIPYNNITVLNDGVFSSLINLVHVNLSYNSIYNIESLAFAGLSKLTILDLHNNKIKSLPSKLFFGLSKLSYYVDLSDNLLATPAFNISSLEKLLLGNNNLSVFTLREMKLNISNNNITKIENFDMYEAIEINLSFNNIKTLNAVGEIIICNISHNGITFVGKHFITSWVSILDLSFNSVYNISSNAFDKGTNLTHLYLNNNNLKELSIGTFKNQEHLEYLHLASNKILYFESGLFNNLGSLRYLNISCNEGILDFQALFPLNQLVTLDFEKNQPENFDKFFFETHVYLRQIRMGYITWNCWDLTKIIHLIENRGITLLKGNNANSTYIHGIECKSNLKYIFKNESKENVSHNQSLEFFDKNFDNTGTNNVQSNNDNDNYFINLNLIFNDVFLVLIFCSFLVLIWYLKKRNIIQSKQQIELYRC